MTEAFLPLASSLGVVAACLLVPPVTGGLVAGAGRYIIAKKQGRKAPPLLQPFHDYYLLRHDKHAPIPLEARLCSVLSMTFHLAALVLLGLQKNLLPILFLQSFGALSMILGGISRTDPYFVRNFNNALKDFLACQSVLFLVVFGLFFATGSLDLSAVKEYPRLLAIDLPLLFISLLFVEHTEQSASTGGAQSNSSEPAVKLANCYRSGTQLLIAGFLLVHSLTGAVAAAILLYVVIALIPFAPVRISRQLKSEWSWGYVYFACCLNLTWIYIKYWS